MNEVFYFWYKWLITLIKPDVMIAIDVLVNEGFLLEEHPYDATWVYVRTTANSPAIRDRFLLDAPYPSIRKAYLAIVGNRLSIWHNK